MFRRYVRSPLALLLIRLAHRIDGHWLGNIQSELGNAWWRTHDWTHDYDESQLLYVARTVLEEETIRMERARLFMDWTIQTYERHHKNPFKNIYWLFKGIFSEWTNICNKATKGRVL